MPDPLDTSVPIAVTDYRLHVFRQVAEDWPDRHLAMSYVERAHASDLALADGRREVHVSIR